MSSTLCPNAGSSITLQVASLSTATFSVARLHTFKKSKSAIHHKVSKEPRRAVNTTDKIQSQCTPPSFVKMTSYTSNVKSALQGLTVGFIGCGKYESDKGPPHAAVD